jgi:hypothetical protein
MGPELTESDLLLEKEEEKDAETLSGSDLDFDVTARTPKERDSERIFDTIIEEVRPKPRSRKRKSNEKVPKNARTRRAPKEKVSEKEDEMKESIENDFIVKKQSADTEVIVSAPSDTGNEDSDHDSQSTASFGLKAPCTSLPSIRDVSSDVRKRVSETDELGIDIGQISPISPTSQVLELSPVILRVSDEPMGTVVDELRCSPVVNQKENESLLVKSNDLETLPKVRDLGNYPNNVKSRESSGVSSDPTSGLPPRPIINNIFTASPKQKKRVGKLGLAKGSKVVNKLSFDLVKSSSQSSIDVERNSSPVSEPKSSPLKPVRDFGKREIVMPVRNVRTITYGRSNLDPENPLGNVNVPSASTEPEEVESDEDHGIDEGLESSDDESKPRVRGIHELREAGHSKRTRDELEYISEGLSSSKLNIQRSTAVDVLKKLIHPQFVTNIRIHGYLNKIFEVCRSHPDTILNVTLCYIICYLGNDLKNLEGLAIADVIQWLFESMDKYLKENIMIQLPKKRYEKGLVLELIGHVQKLQWQSDPLCINALLEQVLCKLVEEKDVASTNWSPTLTVLGHIATAIESSMYTKDCENSILMLEFLTHHPLESVAVYHEANLLPGLWKLLSKTIGIID